MHGWLVLQLLILLIVANGTAVLAKKVLGGTFGRPLDGGATFIDGQPLFDLRRQSAASWHPCWGHLSVRS